MANIENKHTKRLLNWQAKAKKRGQEGKRLRAQNKRLQLQIEKLRIEKKALQKELSLTPLAAHKHPLELVQLGLYLHIMCGVSLRGTSKAMCAMATHLGYKMKAVSACTIRNWSIRLGLYYLTNTSLSGDYVVIADESITIGQEKLLVVLGVAVNDCSRIAPLNFQDVEVLHIEARSSWKGEDIGKVIQEKVAEKGINIAYALSDKGVNLRKCFKTCELVWIEDCTHVFANICDKLFKSSTEDWAALHEFKTAMNKTRNKWVLSKNACYMPPKLRAKGRFHQQFSIYKWSKSIVGNWRELPQEVQEELSYVLIYKDLSQLLEQLHQVLDTFSSIFKSKGISDFSINQWAQSVQLMMEQWQRETDENKRIQNPIIVKLLTELTNYLHRMRQLLPEQDQILCCSDIIESIFGKYKNKGPLKLITDDAVKIAAYTKEISMEEVRLAFEKIDCKTVRLWKDEKKDISFIAKKRKWSKIAA